MNRKYLIIPFWIVGAIVLAILFRVFVFEVYTIRNDSMQDTLIEGDKIFVNKIAFGGSIPKSRIQIPWLGLIFKNEMKGTSEDLNLGKVRRIGKKQIKIKRGDIILFYSPSNKKDIVVKRCIGLPGDTIEIYTSSISINGMDEIHPERYRRSYYIWFNNHDHFIKLIHSLELPILGKYYSTMDNHHSMCLNQDEYNHFLNSVYIDSIKPYDLITESDTSKSSFISGRSMYKNPHWAFTIPRREMVLSKSCFSPYMCPIITKESINLHSCDTCKRERMSPSSDNDIDLNTDYYFVLGDNRNMSYDSRHFGLVPDDAIIGRVDWIFRGRKSRSK